MKVRKHRPLPAFWPSDLGRQFVRYSVHRVPFLPDSKAQRLASGVGLEAEARIIFREACAEIRADAEDFHTAAITLERHTIEVIAFNGPGDYAAEAKAQAPAADYLADLPEPHVSMGPVGAGLAFIGKAIRQARERAVAAAKDAPAPARKLSGREVTEVIYDELGPPPAAVDPHEVLVGMFKIGAGHQGGHSIYGAMIANALKTEFPLTMQAMAIRALECGLDPRTVWDWWDGAPATMDEAVAAYAAANVHD